MIAFYSDDRQYSGTECKVTRFGVVFPPTSDITPLPGGPPNGKKDAKKRVT